jgi:hypothetical protein
MQAGGGRAAIAIAASEGRMRALNWIRRRCGRSYSPFEPGFHARKWPCYVLMYVGR